jgi:hypothetical protein
MRRALCPWVGVREAVVVIATEAHKIVVKNACMTTSAGSWH